MKFHYRDILADPKLLNADIIHLVETSMENDDSQEWIIPGYSANFVNVGNGKGIATYCKLELFKYEQDFKQQNMQVMKFTSPELDSINVYRSNNGNSVELLNIMVGMISKGKTTIITGDFNICMLNHWKNREREKI